MTKTQKTRRNAQKYSDYTEATQAFMKAVEGHLKAKFGDIEPQWEGLLGMLATNYELFWDCKQKIKEDGLMVRNRFGSWEKNPLLKVQTDAQIQLVKLVNEFGISPKSIKNRNVAPNDEDDIIAKLVG